MSPLPATGGIMTKVIGITGGIASGKTMISGWLIDHDYPVIDADIVARQVIDQGSPLLEQIKAVFGPRIFDQDGRLMRRRLGQIVFADSRKRAQLDNIMQPAIRELIKAKLEALRQTDFPLIFLTIPLLYEQHYDALCDAVIVVYVTPEIQRARLQERDQLNQHEADQRIGAQLPLQEKATRADFVIDNNGQPQDSLEQLQAVLTRLRG